MLRTICLGALPLFFTFATMAVDVREKELALDSKTLVLPALTPNYDQALVDLYLEDPSWKAWNDAHGGNWVAQHDTLTGHPRRVSGGALSWLPGRANSLTGSVSEGDLERVAREFIANNQSVLAAGNERLRFVDEGADPGRDARMRYAIFEYAIDGVPVEYGRLIFAVNNGNMIYWHSANIADVPAVTSPSITAEQALLNVLAYIEVQAEDVEVVQEPRLELLPRNTTDGGLLSYQLVYELRFRVDGGTATWVAYVDAIDGVVIGFGDSNRYAACPTTPTGRVTGGIRPAEATDAEVVRSFPLVRVDSGATPLSSSWNGLFTFGGGTVSSELNGTFFDANCVDCVKSDSDPVPGWQPFVSSSSRRLDFGTGGYDHVTLGSGDSESTTISYGNGTSTPADRTAFFHTNVARAMALKWLDLPWLYSTVPVNVNINDICNAFWNGVSVNFFKKGTIVRSSGNIDCNNTGEIRDVMQHEWGHGIDYNDGQHPGYVLGLGDFATGEAVGDHIALFVDHDSCVGQSFYNRFHGPYVTDPDTVSIRQCDGVRNVDELRSSRGTLSISNVSTKCPPHPYYIGPLLRQGHCEGQIWGQAAWHLVESLMSGTSYGTVELDSNKQYVTYEGDPLPAGPDGSPNGAVDRDEAWTLHERLFYESRPLVGSYAPSRHQAIGASTYDAYFVVDDEGDGLSNGTPHGAYLNDAFVHHGMEEWGAPGGVPAYGDAKNCAAIATPAVSLSQGVDPDTGTPAVTISWSAVDGAAHYSVVRTERRHDVFLEVGRSASAGSVVDAGVDNGVTYTYRVVATGDGACYSSSPAGLATITVEQPDARYRSVSVTDSPGGNGDGELDPGEKAQLFIIIANEGLTGLTNAQATLSSVTSGVTVANPATRSYGSIEAGGSAGPDKSFRVTVDQDALLCGATANFILEITSDQGCFLDTFSMPIGDDSTGCVVFRDVNAQPTAVRLASDSVDSSCGDGDLVADPGETVEIHVDVNNNGTKDAHGVEVTLSVDRSYFTFLTSSTVDLGTILGSAAETKTATYTLAVSSDAPFNDTATFTASATAKGQSSPNTLSETVAVNRDEVLTTFSYDYESGAQGWTPSEAETGWILTNGVQTGNATTVWYSQYAPSTCLTLTSPSFEFSDTSAIVFDLAYVSENTDAAWDGIDVQASVDGGNTWIKVEPGYPALSYGSGCIPKDSPMFSGYSPLMARYTADLSLLAGYTGQIRFRWSADPLVEATIVGGAWVDNVDVKDVVTSVPSASCN
ncbi:MAG: hypothetical protein KY459_15985 [Acidobacteria bacterium]|nr:hypothetical protein [Acidobacteriota bacterium]